MPVLKIVFLIAFFTKTYVVTVFGQNSIRLQVIPAIDPGICASQEDRDVARQSLQNATLSAMQ